MKASLLHISLILFGTILGLLISEEAIRVFCVPPQTVEVLPMKLDIISNPARGLYQKTEEVFQLRPNVEAVIHNHIQGRRDIHIRTNDLGFRGAQLGHKVGPRVLFLGDSITVADSVEEQETFVYLIGETISRHGLALEAINAGQGATGLSNHLIILRNSIDTVQPDLVVLDFYLNDFQSSPRRVLSPPGILKKSRLVAYMSNVFSLLGYEFFGVQQGAEMLSERTLASWRAEIEHNFTVTLSNPGPADEQFKAYIKSIAFDAGGAWSNGAWEIMHNTIQSIKQITVDRNVGLAMIAFPLAAQVEHHSVFVDFPQRKLKEVSRALQVPVLDLLPALQKIHASHDDPLFLDQCHFTVYGHKNVASLMTEFIEQILKEQSLDL